MTHTIVPAIVAPMVASAGTTSSPALAQSDISAATTVIFGVVSDTLAQIVSNPIFLIFFVSGLVFMGVRIIRALKRA